MAKPGKKNNPPQLPKTEANTEEIKQRLENPYQDLDRYIESEVNRRVSGWIKVVSWIAALGAGLISTLVAGVVLFMGDDYFKNLVSRKVDEAASPTVVAEITNRLGNIVGQADARLQDMEKNWSTARQNAADVNRMARVFADESTAAFSLLAANRREFLEQINFLNATNNVIAVTELPTLLTNETFPLVPIMSKTFVTLSQPAISNSVQFSIVPYSVQLEGIRNEMAKGFSVTGQVVKFRYMDPDPHRHTTATNHFIRVDYMRMPMPKYTTP